MSRKILLIDDDDLVVRTIKALLSKKGYHVETANNAVDAVSKSAISNFDLVISDIRMPGENGIIAIEKIKKIYEERKVICGYIFISGYAEEDTPAHAIRLGVDKFLYKPFDNKKLLESISEEIELCEQKANLTKVSKSQFIKRFPKTHEDIKAKRVVITGIGCVAPSGIGKKAYWDGLKEGRNCVDRISSFDSSSFPSKVSSEIRDFDPKKFIFEKNEIKRMDRTSHIGIAAARLAVEDANLKLEQDEHKDLGVILGSAIAGLEYVEVDFRALERGGVRRVRPYLGIAGFAGGASSEISRTLGLHGPSFTISTGCTSSTDAMGYAMQKIRNGGDEILITGGSDASVTPGILAAFCQMGAVSMRKDDLHKASRPFNQDRDGFVLGEGAWMFVFEELEHALKRGAKIYGEVIGYSATCDAWHMAKPHPSGEFTARAIMEALDDANVLPSEIDLFESYGNGTPVNDSYETGVVKKVFGDHAYKLAMPSIKSMLGHPLGASGSQQVAAAMMAFDNGIIHPTINYEVPDPECDLDYIPNKSQKRNVNKAVCSSIAFGAKNSAIILQKFKK